MLQQGEIRYAMTTRGDLEPVVVQATQEVVCTTPKGEEYLDLMVTVEDGQKQRSNNVSLFYQYVPYLPEIEQQVT